MLTHQQQHSPTTSSNLFDQHATMQRQAGCKERCPCTAAAVGSARTRCCSTEVAICPSNHGPRSNTAAVRYWATPCPCTQPVSQAQAVHVQLAATLNQTHTAAVTTQQNSCQHYLCCILVGVCLHSRLLVATTILSSSCRSLLLLLAPPCCTIAP